MPLTQELLQEKLQTNRTLSAANLTACDFWMAFFHLTIPIISSRACDLSWVAKVFSVRAGKAPSLPSPSLWVFPPWGIEYLVIVRGKVISTLIFHNCRLPRLYVSDPKTLSCVRHHDEWDLPACQRIADNQFIIIVALPWHRKTSTKMSNVIFNKVCACVCWRGSSAVYIYASASE